MTEQADQREATADPLVEAALDAVDDPALVCDPTGRVRAWNEAAVGALGALDPAGPPVRLVELVDAGDGPAGDGSDPLERAVETGAEARATVRTAGDGHTWTVTCRPVERDGDVAAVLAVFDAEERPALATERVATALSDLPVVLLTVDADGTVEECRGFDSLTSVCDPGCTGASLSAFEAASASLVAGCRRALDGESHRETAAVDDRWFELLFEPRREHGDVAGATVVGVDVTDRERSRQELEATRERLDLALEGTEAGVYEWEIGDDQVYWHEATSRLFGLDPGTTSRPPAAFYDRVHPEERETLRERILASVETDGYVDEEFRIVRPDGEVRWMVTEGKVQYEDGEPDRLVGFARDVTERKEREQRSRAREERLRAVIESSADPIAMQDRDGRYQVVNRAMLAMAGPDATGRLDDGADCDRADLLGARPAEVFDQPFADRLETHRADVLESERARVVKEQVPGDGETLTLQLTVAPYHGPDGEVEGTVTIARDITDIERQRDELERLAAIQDLVQDSVRALTSATTREGIRETVCERLANSQFYECAWIGEREPSSLEVEPRYVAGDDGGYLDDITITVAPDETGRGPGGRAYRSGEVQVVHDVVEEFDNDHWREAATERGFRSVACVPLTHGSTVHGVLGVYASEPGAFSRRELGGFRALGEVVGFALSAAQYRRLVEADSVLELEFEVANEGAPFVGASREHDCRFVVEHAVHTGNERVLDYVSVEGAEPELIERIASDVDGVEQVRALDHDDGPQYELTITGSVFQHLAEVGARGKRAVVEDGVGHLSVEAPGDIDLLQVTEAVERSLGDASLSAKREKQRADSPWWYPAGDASANLTDRQRDVLRTAYYSGYYEWPRETDSETLADSMDVASTTFLQHLRKGHRRILERMFES